MRTFMQSDGAFCGLSSGPFQAASVLVRKASRMTPNELAARRAAKKAIGWDECGATGAGHDGEEKPQADGCFYCRYCGAEMLPEETANGRYLAEEAFDAVERFCDWTGDMALISYGGDIVPAEGEWRRIKARQALDAMRECLIADRIQTAGGGDADPT